MSQFSQWINSAVKEKENELQALYMLQNKDKEKNGQAGAGLVKGRNKSLRKLMGF